MKEEQKESKVWAEIGVFKEGRLQWVEMVKVPKGNVEALEDLLTRRLNSLKRVGAWELRTRTCRFENGRSHFGDWEDVR